MQETNLEPESPELLKRDIKGKFLYLSWGWNTQWDQIEKYRLEHSSINLLSIN